MNSHLAQHVVELLQLDALGRVLAVLGGDVARGARLPRVLMLSAFKDYLHPVAFLSHLDGVFGLRTAKVQGNFGLPNSLLVIG